MEDPLTDELESVFNEHLKQDDPRAVTEKQRRWLSFQAGAKWAMEELTKAVETL
jgi:hypothetical protein